jgi:hypothetical protein
MSPNNRKVDGGKGFGRKCPWLNVDTRIISAIAWGKRNIRKHARKIGVTDGIRTKYLPNANL